VSDPDWAPGLLLRMADQRTIFATLACVVLAALTCAGLTACGGSSSSSRNKLATISTCLRKEGLAPSSTDPGEVPLGMTPKQLVVALKKCGVRGGTFSGAEESGPTSPAKRIVVGRELVKQVTCLQEHGFQVTATKNVEQQLFNANGVDTKSARFRAANRECRQKFVEAIRKLGPGYAPDEGNGRSSVASTGAEEPIANPQAIAYAHTVNLRRSDVRALVPTARQKEGTGTFLGRCERPVGSDEAIGIPSQAFTQNLERKKGPGVLGVLSIYPEESVRSAVYTTTTSTRAAHALDVAIGPVGQTCLRQSFPETAEVRSESGQEEPLFAEVKVFPIDVQVGRVHIQGMRASASLAAVMTNTSKRQPYYDDLLGFSCGPSEIFLKVSSSPSDPAATERRLLALLHTRAQANKLS
jgi:hypothetical protein